MLGGIVVIVLNVISASRGSHGIAPASTAPVSQSTCLGVFASLGIVA